MTQRLIFCSVKSKKLLSSKQISCEELVKVHIDQIEKYNPYINAMVTLSYDLALENAKEFDNKPEKQSGILAGLPVAVKDLEETSGIKTTFDPEYIQKIYRPMIH